MRVPDGFPPISYAEYLLSDHWASVRSRVLKIRKSCLACKSQDNIHIHHIHYRVYKERLRDVCPLCRDCHRKLHARMNEMYPGMPVYLQATWTREVFLDLFGFEMPWWKQRKKKGPKKFKHKGRKNKPFRAWMVAIRKADRLQTDEPIPNEPSASDEQPPW